MVYAILQENGLENYYRLKPGKTLPLTALFARKDALDWVEKIDMSRAGRLLLAIEGIQCTACVWAVSELARRFGEGRAQVDPVMGTLSLTFVPDRFPLKSYLGTLQNLGYYTAPLDSEHAKNRQTGDRESRGLLLRLGVCAAIAINVMGLSAGLYVGLNGARSSLYTLFHQLNALLALIAVAVGGSYFFDRALRAIRQGLLHFDLPIAIGILATFLGSLYAFLKGEMDKTYFDTVSSFITLMLAGRYGQLRFVLRNRHALARCLDIAALRVTRLQEGVEEIPFSAVRLGDRLLIKPGGILPVPAVLEGQEPAICSLAWISGEPLPIHYEPGSAVPAGAILANPAAVVCRAEGGFSDGHLSALLPAQKLDDFQVGLLPAALVRNYVIGVLAIATAGFLFWQWWNPEKALFVFTATLVVTCPCGLGIALPTARAIANRLLLSHGVFARRGAIFERLPAIRHIAFDKTGTLTFAGLALKNPEAFAPLSQADRCALWNAVIRSHHPASQSLAQALSPLHLPYLDRVAREVAGEGIHIESEGHCYFIGRPKDPEREAFSYTLVFTKNGRELARFAFDETLLEDGENTISALKRRGLSLFLLSGDREARALRIGKQLGFSAECIFGDCRPEEKARRIQAIGKTGPVLMLGDGLNDGQALSTADLSGTALNDKSALAESSDFFFISNTLRFVPALFAIVDRLRATARLNVRYAVLYNGIAISIALSGLLTPLGAALLMPASALFILALSVAYMKKAGTT